LAKAQKTMNRIFNLIILAWISAPSLCWADQIQGNISIGPLAGGGSLSNGLSVRYVSGFRLNWLLTQSRGSTWTYGPVVAVQNTYVNAGIKVDSLSQIIEYDNRTGQIGIQLMQNHYAANKNRFYLQVLSGLSAVKLTIGEVSSNAFTKRNYQGIKGITNTFEIGMKRSMKPNFELKIATLFEQNYLDQSSATGTLLSEVQSAQGMSLKRADIGSTALQQNIQLNSISLHISANFLL
jgi:hypothetical protein